MRRRNTFRAIATHTQTLFQMGFSQKIHPPRDQSIYARFYERGKPQISYVWTHRMVDFAAREDAKHYFIINLVLFMEWQSVFSNFTGLSVICSRVLSALMAQKQTLVSWIKTTSESQRSASSWKHLGRNSFTPDSLIYDAPEQETKDEGRTRSESVVRWRNMISLWLFWRKNYYFWLFIVSSLKQLD